jgi:hypothetical protein
MHVRSDSWHVFSSLPSRRHVTNAVKHSVDGVESEADEVAAVNAACELSVEELPLLPQATVTPATAMKMNAILRCDLDMVSS